MLVTYSLKQHRKAVGKVLKDFRQRAGLTQEEAASKAGMDRSHLSELESGNHDPGFYLLAELAAVYRAPLVDLVREAESKATALAAKSKRRKEKTNRH